MICTPAAEWDWNIAVFCQNEQDTIIRCLRSIEQASRGHRVLVCLIVNGSTDSSIERAIEFAASCTFDFIVASIETGDKANAINTFNEVLRVAARTYIYVDGYVGFTPGSLQALAACLADTPDAVAATGICTTGRTMKNATQKTLEEGGVLHGQLHAFRPEFIARMSERKIRLPIGLYWGDGLLGSMAAHDLDAVGSQWVDSRVKGVEDARYQIESLSIFKLKDLIRQARRMVRQALGRLQNRAITDLIYRSNYESLPEYADDMVKSYLAAHGAPTVSLVFRPFLWKALIQMKETRRPTPVSLQARIEYSSRPELDAHIRSPTALLPTSRTCCRPPREPAMTAQVHTS